MILTPLEVADAWIAAGGPKNRATEWTAIALGESGYDTEAVSSAGALGLWQIMPFNFAPNGVSQSDWTDPLANATVAVRLSGGGTNCAAWDSCYEDIEVSGRFTYLAWPQPGSADYANLAIVSAQLGTDKLGGAVPPTGPFTDPAGLAAEARMNTVLGAQLPALYRALVWQLNWTNRIGLPGYQP